SSADPAFGAAMVNLLSKHKRNISVLARRLVLTPDPSSQAFKDALAKVILLCERNLSQKKTIKVAGTTGLCAGHPGDHARTLASAADPKTHLCEIFFTGDGLDLQRD